MKISFFYQFLIGNINYEELKQQINKEVETYKLALQKKGASIIISIDEDLQFSFKKDHLLKLCTQFLNDDLTPLELEYLADYIMLREHAVYEQDELIDLLEVMTDSSINGELTKEKVVRIINAIGKL